MTWDADHRAGQLEPGQLLFGRYVALRRLGRGGMGSVWLVRHRELDTERALKIIAPEIALTPETLGRFRREARVMAKLSHPHVVTVHDAQVHRDGSFIEMEFVQGRSLDALLRPGVPARLEWAAQVLVQLCDVLQAAHDQQIVHRDLKPSNLMLLDSRPPDDPFLKVLDFGIAKILAPEDQCDARTRAGTFIGSPPYTSPEQAVGGDIDCRSDLYSVGIILYQVLTGYLPFSGSIAAVIHHQLHTPPPRFAEKNPDVDAPSEVEQAVLRCLAKQPDRRYQSARELAEAFLRAASSTGMALAGGAPLPSGPQSISSEHTPGDSTPVTASGHADHDGQDVIATFDAFQQAARTEARGDRGRGSRAGQAGHLSSTPDRLRPMKLWFLLVGSTLVAGAALLSMRPTESSDGRALIPPTEPPRGEVRPGGAERSQGPPVREPTSRPAQATPADTGRQPVGPPTVAQPANRPAGVTAPARIEEGINRPKGPRLALVIGIDAYPETARLGSCVNDAKAVTSWLLAEGYHPDEIALLTDARKRDIIRALQEVARACKARRHEQVVIFFSGHGTTLPDDDGDEGPDDETDEAFLACFARGDPWEDFVIRDDQFFLYVNAIAAGAKRLLIMFDCCHSGGVLKGDLDEPKARKIKEIPEWRLRRMQVEAGQRPGPFREGATVGRRGGLDGDKLPAEIQAPPEGHHLVFLAACNPFQVARCGDRLSAFTEAFIAGVFRERHRVVAGADAMTFGALRRYLSDSLYSIPQSPIVLLRGLTEDEAFIPGFFPDPLKVLREEKLMGVLESLLTLPAATRVDGATLYVRTSQPGPLRLGTRFALRVQPGASGYLVVFTVSPGGNVSFLFPNRHRPDNFIKKAQDAMIPYAQGLEIRPPVGEETYFVYLLEKNPFADFPFGLYGEALVVGRLEDVARRLKARGTPIGADELREALVRGRAVEVAKPAKVRETPDRCGAWVRKEVIVKSVE
jgi:serine/threonine-protein kinase